MKTMLLLKKHAFQISTTLMLVLLCATVYLSNADMINHEAEMMLLTRSQRTMVSAQVNNFRFIMVNFGEDTAKMNFLKIMTDDRVLPEVKKIVRLAYIEHLKD